MAIDRRGIEAADVAGRRDDARPAEERLREALEFRERLFAASAVGLLVYDDEGRCVMVNDAASRAIGGSREQLLSQNFRGLASWRASGLLDLAEDALATGEDRAGVLRIVTTFGRDAWWDCRLTPFSAGGRRHLLLQVNDVGERRRAEAALLASEARFRAFMRHFPGLAYIKDGEGRVLFANEGFARHLGLDPEKLLGRTNEEIFGPGTGGAFAAEDSRVLASGGDSAVEEEVQGRIWATRKFCIAEPGAPPLLGGITIDISERKRAEDALADERARIQAVLENLPMGVVVYDGVPFRSVLQNAAAEVILGRPAPGAIEEAALAGYFEAMRAGTDEPYPAERMPLVQALRGKRTAVDDMDVRRPDGTRVPLEVFGIPIASPSGAPAAVVVFLDITERRRWEAVTVARARLAEFASGRALDEILTRAVDDAEALTGSRIGFCHFLEPDERHFSVQVFSTRTNREFCTAEGLGLHCDLDRAGVWVDCVRQRRPVIHNDVASLPHRKGMPEGHPAVVRELVVPVFRDEKIVAMLGVGNKATDYDESDVRMVALFADLAWTSPSGNGPRRGSGGSRNSSSRRGGWSRSGFSPAAWRTTSTTCSRRFWATPRSCCRSSGPTTGAASGWSTSCARRSVRRTSCVSCSRSRGARRWRCVRWTSTPSSRGSSGCCAGRCARTWRSRRGSRRTWGWCSPTRGRWSRSC